jgi:hypothetical protein
MANNHQFGYEPAGSGIPTDQKGERKKENGMTKKVSLALGCFGLLVTFTNASMADNIAFHFNGGGSVTATSAQFTSSLTTLVSAEDTDTNTLSSVTGNASLKTGAAASWSTSGSQLDFQFGPGGSVSVTSGFTTLLTGNTVASGLAIMALHNGKTGSISGDFAVTYVNPIVLSWFGLTGQTIEPSGAWSLNTSKDASTSSTFSAQISGGTISFATDVVPEPGTLALMGTGMLGLVGWIRRKVS